MDELFICFTLPLVVLFAVEVEKWLIRKGWIYGLKTAEST
jgi:Ca2+-transporting ATPase